VELVNEVMGMRRSMLSALTLSFACYSGSEPSGLAGDSSGDLPGETGTAVTSQGGSTSAGTEDDSGVGSTGSTEAGVDTGEGDSEGGEVDLAPADAPFARLTREEYRQTVLASLGAAVDVQAVPADGRVGPFTSNASQETDPVHPFLIASEELARGLVPEALAACDPDEAQACIEDTYRGPLEVLFRRSVSDAEVEALAQVVVEVAEAGASPEEATEAMLGAALLSPDFLFRTSASAAGADPLGRQRAEHVSYTLWDAPPDAELTAAAMDALPAQALRLSKAPEAVAVFARFLAQWLHVDTDVRLLDPGFDASADYLELLAYASAALQDDQPIADFMAGAVGLVHRDNFEAYGIEDDSEYGDEPVVAMPWTEDSGRVGLLGQELFASTTRHPDASRRAIFRGALFWNSLVCIPVPSPPAGLVDMNDEVTSRLEDDRCSGCHQVLEPVGGLFAPFDRDVALEPSPATLSAPAELAGTYDDLAALLSAVGGSRVFADCFARHWLAFFLERRTQDVSDEWVTELGAQIQDGASLSQLVEQTVTGFLGRSEATVAWCEGE